LETTRYVSLQNKDFYNLHAIFNKNTLLKPQMLAYDLYGPEGVKIDARSSTETSLNFNQTVRSHAQDTILCISVTSTTTVIIIAITMIRQAVTLR
jgi:hypothetical protein